MAKYMPLQVTSLVFEIIKNNFEPGQRPELKQNFHELFRNLE
jgi:hypothetical protein